MADKIVLDNGKYTVVNALNEGGGFKALRYGEEWRNLVGDGLVLAMFHEIERLIEELSEAESLLSEAHDVMDDVHLSDTELFREISKYFNGEEDE